VKGTPTGPDDANTSIVVALEIAKLCRSKAREVFTVAALGCRDGQEILRRFSPFATLWLTHVSDTRIVQSRNLDATSDRVVQEHDVYTNKPFRHCLKSRGECRYAYPDV